MTRNGGRWGETGWSGGDRVVLLLPVTGGPPIGTTGTVVGFQVFAASGDVLAVFRPDGGHPPNEVALWPEKLGKLPSAQGGMHEP